MSHCYSHKSTPEAKIVELRAMLSDLKEQKHRAIAREDYLLAAEIRSTMYDLNALIEILESRLMPQEKKPQAESDPQLQHLCSGRYLDLD